MGGDRDPTSCDSHAVPSSTTGSGSGQPRPAQSLTRALSPCLCAADAPPERATSESPP